MITISPGTNINTTINNNPSETVFQLQNGLHRITTAVNPRAGMTLQGESLAAILSGAKELHSSGDATDGNFTDAGGGRFVIGNQTQQGSVSGFGECQAGFPECHQPEDLWIDDVLQVPQTNITDVDGAGKWHFDYGNNNIYIWASPANKQIETSVTQKAINGAQNNVTLLTFTVDKFAAPFQNGAISGLDGGTNWTVDGLDIRDVHGTGIQLVTDWEMRNCHVHRCGQLGFSCHGPGGVKSTGIIVENNEVDTNGVSGINPGAAGGACKLTNTIGAIIRGNFVHHNPGNGLWADIDNENVVVGPDNIVEDNGYQGIFIEISFGGTVFNNQVRRNGFARSNATGFGAGILIASSSDVEVFGNVVEDCHNGIAANQQNRGSGDKGGVNTIYGTTGLFVHHNTVVLLLTNGDAQRVGLWRDYQPPELPDLYSVEADNRWIGNSYDLSGATSLPFRWEDANIDFASWQAAGQDPPGPPTRFYLDSTNIPTISPPVHAEWDVVGATQRYRKLNRQKLGSAFTTRSITSGTTLGEDVHWRTYVYQGLPALLISGFVKGMVRCREPNVNADSRMQCRIFVCSQDGLTERGTLLDFDQGLDDPPTSEFIQSTTIFQARKAPRGWTGSGATVSPVQTQAGDCLCIELGWRHMESGTTRTSALQEGDPISSSDVPEDETNQVQAASWFEFSTNIGIASTQAIPAVAVGVATLTAKQVVGKTIAATAVGVATLGTQLIESPGPGNPTRPRPRPKKNRRRR